MGSLEQSHQPKDLQVLGDFTPISKQKNDSPIGSWIKSNQTNSGEVYPKSGGGLYFKSTCWNVGDQIKPCFESAVVKFPHLVSFWEGEHSNILVVSLNWEYNYTTSRGKILVPKTYVNWYYRYIIPMFYTSVTFTFLMADHRNSFFLLSSLETTSVGASARILQSFKQPPSISRSMIVGNLLTGPWRVPGHEGDSLTRTTFSETPI